MTASLGFLSVRQHAEHGYFGGYLITNPLARPLEFHCTMPVKPSRAQALLYGSTIDAFVAGEQIAKALVLKAKLKPEWVLTDCAAVLAISTVSDVDAAFLQIEDQPVDSFSPPQGEAGELKRTSIVPWQISLLASRAEREPQLKKTLEELATNFDLSEPFQRIYEALLEAHPIAKAA